MVQSLNLPLNVDVHCKDGRCGRSTHLIINPALDKVTHLIVKERQPSKLERLVPVRLVASSGMEVILLNCTREEFSKLEPFNQTDFIFGDLMHHAQDPALTMLWPYVVPKKRVIDDKFRRIPPGELAIKRGARVIALDGKVGQVNEFVVDPENGYITHLVLREGHVWGKQSVCIPLAQIDRIEENIVYLKIDKAAIAAMPKIQIERKW